MRIIDIFKLILLTAAIALLLSAIITFTYICVMNYRAKKRLKEDNKRDDYVV